MANKKVYVKDGIRKICQGEQLILSVGVEHNSFVNPENDNHLHYLWTRDGVPFGDQEGDLAYHDFIRSREFWDRPTITLDNIKVEDSGIYQCEVSNQFGTVLSEPTSVEVLDALNSPLLARNLVQNGEMRDGDSGWNVIEGSQEQDEPFFWDGLKRKGFASRWNVTPSVREITDIEKYPNVKDGDRLMGVWKNRGGWNEVKLQQDIDLIGLRDAIDRNIEGITTVDLRCAAWLIGTRFHPKYDHAFLKLKDDLKPSYGRGTVAGDPIGQNLNSYWWLRAVFYYDQVRINYICYNDKGDELRRVQISNVPNSYMSSLTAFKHRRIEVPKGTRKLRVEIRALRDGTRPSDLFDGQLLDQIRSGCWGINARIYVNGIGDDFNTGYKIWQMPGKHHINPAVLNWKYTNIDLMDNYFYNHVEQKAIGGKSVTYKKATWRGIPAWRTYRKGDGTIKQNWKWFDIWRNVPDNTEGDDPEWERNFYSDNAYDTELDGYGKVGKTWHDGHNEHKYDRWFGIPTSITSAAKADLNLKRMILTWLKDYNLNKMDEDGRNSVMHFHFNVPVMEGDQQDLATTIGKRRRLILPDSHQTPIIRQELYMGDLDESIYHVHASTYRFSPTLNNDQHNETYQATTGDIWESGEYYVSEYKLYWPFSRICDTGLYTSRYSDWHQILDFPRTTGELESIYWCLKIFYWHLLKADMNHLDDASISDGTMEDKSNEIITKLKVEEIYEHLLVNSGIPVDQFSLQEDTIRKWIGKRLTQHLLDSAFRSKIKRLEDAADKDPYKDSIKVKDSKELPLSSADEWHDGDTPI